MNVNFLKSWLVFHPVDTVALGQSFSSCALFDKIRVLTPEIFESRAQSLSMLFVKYGVSHFIDLYVAFGEAIATVNGGDGGGGIKNNSSIVKNMVMDDDIDKNASFGIYIATVPFLPLLTQTFIYNIDYDGSGSLTLEEISQDRGDVFSAVVNAKDAVLKDIRSLPDFFRNLAPLIQGLNNLN